VTYEWEVNIDPSGTIYSFRIPNLPVKSDDKTVTYSYSIIEKTLDGYETHYGQIEENSVQIPETDGEGNPVYEEDGTTQKYKTVIKKQFADENLERITNGKVISNKKEEPQTGTLNITKAVSEGSDASGKTFSFEVTLKNADDSDFTNAVNVTDSTRQTATSVTPNQDGKITVTVTGTGTAVITDIPAGIKYTVSEPTGTIPSGWKQEGTVAVTGGNADQTITAGETETATITNTPTEFEFSKVWKNANGTQYDTWQKDIKVTLYRKSKKSGSVEETVKVFSIANGTAAINSELNTSYNAEISITGGDAPERGKENKGYKYTITGAGLAAYDSEGYEYDYYVKEADVTFYTTTYGVFDGEGDGRTPRAVDGSTSATDGGVIINTPVDAVELPSTGGSGTHLIYILGSALTIFAAALLGIRRIRHGQ
jgi:LPXTG-motif cell wall-anchored protein